MNLRSYLFTSMLAAALAGGCSDLGTIVVAVEVPNQTTLPTPCADLTAAQFVISELELDQLQQSGEQTSSTDGDVEEIEAGPFLIDLTEADFSGMMLENFLQARVPRGIYGEMEFKIHKLGNDPNDVAAAAAKPALAKMSADGVSVRITGTTVPDRVAFEFTSSLSAEQERQVRIEVGNSITGIDGATMLINPGGWFAGPSPECLNPSDPTNRLQIEANIKASIDFKDDDGPAAAYSR